MYVSMPITDIALFLRHGMLYKKLVASVIKMLDHYNHNTSPYDQSLYLSLNNSNKLITLTDISLLSPFP